MTYESVDKLQKALAETVFSHTKDSKKAAGRALGTLVEIITYYLLRTWRLNDNISIERGLAEYGNPEITHNVEYSLHPLLRSTNLTINAGGERSISTKGVFKLLQSIDFSLSGFQVKSNNLIDRDGILRNACTLASSSASNILCNFEKRGLEEVKLSIYEQHIKPFAIFECKRVGVEEGNKKGPQTIEKAKQGAYVARSASSLQKIRTESGELYGIIYKSDNSHCIMPYVDLMEQVIASNDPELLRRFILTIGVVSNHGNWFTSENQNKELKVLSQSYDWLLFLSDIGLSEFIETLILNPETRYEAVKKAFAASYAIDKKKNQFTKTQMNIAADNALTDYFSENAAKIEGWINIIAPKGRSLGDLKVELNELKTKNWPGILK